jgi:hypothetical protein
MPGAQLKKTAAIGSLPFFHSLFTLHSSLFTLHSSLFTLHSSLPSVLLRSLERAVHPACRRKFHPEDDVDGNHQ